MAKCDDLAKRLTEELSTSFESIVVEHNEVTVECGPNDLLSFMQQLKKVKGLEFNQLMDVCAVDYLDYGKCDWETESATDKGFSRATQTKGFSAQDNYHAKSRFAVVYHLLSLKKNHRLRVKVFTDAKTNMVPSVIGIWKSADWFEREAYDLYGILFDGHPDLRRILTDYGFIGHPFRKDFPLSGHVEMRYDASKQKVVYEPVDIEPRINVPKVIRDDGRYNHALDDKKK